MHKHVDVNRVVVGFRKPLPEICIPRQAITYLPRALKTTIAAEFAHRSLARTLCFPLLTLTTRTLDGLGLFFATVLSSCLRPVDWNFAHWLAIGTLGALGAPVARLWGTISLARIRSHSTGYQSPLHAFVLEA